ncbi:HAD family hydrolase [Streptomyces sp. NPDC005548]|uniref:HAD family hydrolase n=1 Tax=Streptomyces sp. NPDC005548 TaxID=3364724 RepID=UPI00367C3C30
MALRATVFDLDDTLLDSGQAWERVCAGFVARHGHTWTSEDSATLHGNGNWPAFLARLCGNTVDRAAMVEQCAATMAEDCAAGRIPTLPGAVELVRESECHGPVAIASASPRRFVHAALDHLGLRARTVICGEDVAQGKPAPEPYLRAAAGLGLAPTECLAVEDSMNGIRSAAAAGCTVLAIPRAGTRLPDTVALLASVSAPNASDARLYLSRLLATPVPTLCAEAAR